MKFIKDIINRIKDERRAKADHYIKLYAWNQIKRKHKQRLKQY